MKLSLARVTLAALTIGALTACGSGAPSDTTTSSSTAGGAFPRTVEHAMGSTTIPSQPQRVAALDASFTDATLMLDTKVVAFTEYNTLGSKLPDYLGASATNLRCTWSSNTASERFACRHLRRCTPCSPWTRMSRSTRCRPQRRS